MRPRLAVLATVLATVLVLTGCGSTVVGTATPGGALLTLAEDVDLGIADLGGDGRLQFVALDGEDRPVLVSTTEFAGPPGITRGADLSTREPVAAMARSGQATALGVAPDGTAVLLGFAGELVAPSVVRVAPDGTETVLPLALPDVVDPFSAVGGSSSGEGAAFSPDASLVALADVPVGSSSSGLESAGTLQVAVVDTTTGDATEVVEIGIQDPAPVPTGGALPLRVEALAMTDTGEVAVVLGIEGQESQLIVLDAGLDPVGPAVSFGRPGSEYGTHLALDAEGTAYLTQTGPGVRLLRVPAGAAEAEEVATLAEDSSVVGGLVVDPSGTWAYVTGLTDIDLGQTVTAVDLGTGIVAPRTAVCRQGFTDTAVLGTSGTTLLVSTECSDETTNEEHLYLLRAA